MLKINNLSVRDSKLSDKYLIPTFNWHFATYKKYTRSVLDRNLTSSQKAGFVAIAKPLTNKPICKKFLESNSTSVIEKPPSLMCFGTKLTISSLRRCCANCDYFLHTGCVQSHVNPIRAPSARDSALDWSIFDQLLSCVCVCAIRARRPSSRLVSRALRRLGICLARRKIISVILQYGVVHNYDWGIFIAAVTRRRFMIMSASLSVDHQVHVTKTLLLSGLQLILERNYIHKEEEGGWRQAACRCGQGPGCDQSLFCQRNPFFLIYYRQNLSFFCVAFLLLP